FGAAAKPGDGAALQPLDEILGQRPAQVAAVYVDLGKTRAFHDRLQAAAHGFDFGQFGHLTHHAHAAGFAVGSPKVMRLPNGSFTVNSSMPHSCSCSPGRL